MTVSSFKPLDREQFSLLREAKRIIRDEFDKDLKLQDKDVVQQLYHCSLESVGDRLFEIFEQLNSKPTDIEPVASVVEKPKPDEGGKRVVGYYRGQPVYK